MLQEEKSEVLQILEQKGISNLTKSQQDSILSGEAYIQKHKIEVIFQEMLAHIINVQPDNVKEFLVQQLKQRKQVKSTYFTENDFETYFDHYDFAKEQKIPQQFVLQALGLIGVQMTQEQLDKQYRASFEDEKIDKEEFLKIMNAEYNKRIF